MALIRRETVGRQDDPRVEGSYTLMLLFAVTAEHGLAVSPAVHDGATHTARTDVVSWADFTAGKPLDQRFDLTQQQLIRGLRDLFDRPLGGQPWLPISGLVEDMWGMLRAIQQSGVMLSSRWGEQNCEAGGASCTLVPGIDLGLSADLSDSGDIVVKPHAVLAQPDCTPIDGAIMLIGKPSPHGLAWYPTGHTTALHLGQLNGHPSPFLARLLERRQQSMVVPRADVAEFVRTLDSLTPTGLWLDDPDDAITKAQASRPYAVLSITSSASPFDDNEWFELRWYSRYMVADRNIDVPPTARPTGIRNISAESELWEAVYPYALLIRDACNVWCGRAYGQSMAAQHQRRGPDDAEPRLPAVVIRGNEPRGPLDFDPLAGAPDGTCSATSPSPAHVLTGSPITFRELLDICTRIVPELQALDNVIVELDDSIPTFQRATTTPTVRFESTPTDSRDWLDLAITVDVDGHRMPIDAVITELDSGAEHLTFPDGTYVPIDTIPHLSRLSELLKEARAVGALRNTKAPTVSANATLWKDIFDCGDVDDSLSDWAKQHNAIAVTTPPQPVRPSHLLHAELRPYQREGLNWLAFLRHNNLGGVLADDMGLGKTLQLLALMAHTLDNNPDARFLVIAPTSVVSNWIREAARFVPTMSTFAVGTSMRRANRSAIAQATSAALVVSTYTLVRNDAEFYRAQNWTMLVADEAQAVKNPASKAHKAIRDISAETVIALSGTPIENSLLDLWSLLALTTPALFPSKQEFLTHYRTPIERANDKHRLMELRARIRPMMLRRTKEEVAAELPPKQEQSVLLNLSSQHRRIYDRALTNERQKALQLLDDGDPQARFQVFSALTRLRLLSLHPGLADDADAAVGSVKVDYLTEQLPQIAGEGHHALVFSVFPSFLRLLRPALEIAGLRVAYLDGQTSKDERDEQINAFGRRDADVFLISLKAGGTGINLVAADYVYVTDPWWNPASEAQAIDRAYRIGQTRPVTVYRLIADNTIEGKVAALQATKRDLANAVIAGDDPFTRSLSNDELRSLIDN